MSDTQEYSIKPFDANLINPREDNFNTVGGSKIVVIGKAGTGKSTLIRYLLFLKRIHYTSWNGCKWNRR